MSLDAWINFNLSESGLSLPFFCRFEPTDDNSRKKVTNEFQAIYEELNSTSDTSITFYSDYVEPFVKKVKPILDIETLRKLMH